MDIKYFFYKEDINDCLEETCTISIEDADCEEDLNDIEINFNASDNQNDIYIQRYT